jgi:hypothetical protein
MWTDQTAVPIPSDNYTLYNQLKNYGFDSKNSTAFWTVLISSISMTILQIWAWLPLEADF